ncbi:heat shock cognate 70 kDa protein-like protein [Tanacetum coccineum]
MSGANIRKWKMSWRIAGRVRVVKIKGWHVVAIRNSKTPSDWSLKGKHVGYLFAIQHGAKKIFDFDDRRDEKEVANANLSEDVELCKWRSKRFLGWPALPIPQNEPVALGVGGIRGNNHVVETDEGQSLSTGKGVLQDTGGMGVNSIVMGDVSSNNKRLIRNRFSDSTVQPDMKLWPLNVIMVEHKGKYEEYSPDEISCMILNNLKESAEAFLATEVVDAVITVLAYFSDKQRHTIKDAGTLAALNVMRLISKPTAANCICYRKEC